MVEDIYDPLNEYISTFKDKFKKVADETFNALADEAQVDVEANRETCRQIYAGEKNLADVSGRITMWTILCVILWIAVVAGGAVVYVKWNEFPMEHLLMIGGGAALLLVFLLLKVHPKLKSLRTQHNELDNKVKTLKEQAWNQMAALNRLYDWDVFTRMMSKTVPRLEFDPYFTTQRWQTFVKHTDGTTLLMLSVLCFIHILDLLMVILSSSVEHERWRWERRLITVRKPFSGQQQRRVLMESHVLCLTQKPYMPV